MKLPRDLKGSELIKLLSIYGYERIHQRGSHAKLRGPHGVIVVPVGHLKVGLLRGIIRQVAKQIDKNAEEVLKELLG